MASTSESCLSHDHSLAIEQFRGITGASVSTAVKMLEACNWNVELAVNMHVDSEYHEGEDNSVGVANNSNEKELDSIRPPIPQSRGVLVDDPTILYRIKDRKRRPHTIFDGLRDFQAEAMWQERGTDVSAEMNDVYKKRRTLEDLFRPPLDIMYRGSFESARESGQKSNRWLMVNVQDSQEFACQVLNRDVWSNKTVKSLISENFIFWQVYSDSSDGLRYIQFYKPVEFPYIAVIDPRTGEKLVVWNKVDATSFCDLVTMFLNDFSSPNGSIPHIKDSLAKFSVLDQSEEYQIKAALEASLKEATVNVEDNESDFETFDSDTESLSSKTSKINNAQIVSDNSNDTIDVVGLSGASNDNTDVKIEKSWKDYLGNEDDPKTDLVFRFPDGKKEQVTWPCSTKMKSLVLYIEELGYDQEKYELVTNYPRRNLCQLDLLKTLKDANLFSREMIFVQLKS